MEAHRTRAVVGESGSVTLRDVPFQQGEEVEVIMLSEGDSEEKPPVSTEEKKQTVLQSGLAGLWKDRDLPPSPEYARQLREQAQNRPRFKDLDLGGLNDDSS